MLTIYKYKELARKESKEILGVYNLIENKDRLAEDIE